jgi:peptidoglycan L-alanyl-D-glutamate endopeptidase CwlK
MINSRDLKDLLPRTAAKASKLINEARLAGIDLIVTSTYRDNESQDALYAQGRTLMGKRVTNVRGGDSYHNHRVAFDVVPVFLGKAVWDDLVLWSRIGSLGTMLGLEWGGYWDKFPDRPHFQDPAGFTLADYKAGKAS